MRIIVYVLAKPNLERVRKPAFQRTEMKLKRRDWREAMRRVADR